MKSRKDLPLTVIEATTIPDAWFQCIYNLMDVGFKYTIDRGSFTGDTRLEFDHIVIKITEPYAEPYDLMLPDIPASYGIPNPVDSGYVEQYLPYLLTDHVEPGEQYTYGSRIYDQINFWTDIFRKTPNTNQAVLQIAEPGDYKLSHSPCLRHIDMRIKKGYLIFYPYFRSWDLWGGFPANLAAIAVLQKMMADNINNGDRPAIAPGPIVASSKGLHIYGYVEELAKLRAGKIS